MKINSGKNTRQNIKLIFLNFMVYLDGNFPIYDLAESLKKIEKSIRSIIGKKLEVNTYNEEVRIRIVKEQKEKLEQQIKELKSKGRI